MQICNKDDLVAKKHELEDISCLEGMLPMMRNRMVMVNLQICMCYNNLQEIRQQQQWDALVQGLDPTAK